jgi:glycosyltransferase involved in cell wall biosynthesis
MVICHVWDADYPWDVRVEKICDSLVNKHEVHLVCRNSQRRPRYEYVNHLHIHRLPCLPERFGPLNGLMGFPAFFNPVWLYSTWRTVRRTKADVILVRDLPLALTAVAVGRLVGLPVVLDMAENYPAMIQDLWDRQGFSVVDALVRNPKLVGLVERISLKLCDHIVVVVEESRDRVVALGIPASKVSLVINTPTLDRLYSAPESRLSGALPRPDTVTLIYLGLIESPRGLDTVIEGMERLRDRNLNLRLRIIGSGRDTERLRAMVREKALTDRVEFLGWVDYRAAIRHIHEADIGLVPHHATESWNTTIPNKLFDYMSMGKAVIVSNAKPTERIVMEEHCGAVFKERDPDDFAKAVIKLNDADFRQACGQRGREAVIRRYNWQRDEERLLAAMEIAAAQGGRSRCVES